LSTPPFSLFAEPRARYFKELIDSGYIGNPFHFHILFTSGGYLNNNDYIWKRDKTRRSTGTLGGHGSHVIDLARWFFGDVRRIEASLKAFRPVADPKMPSTETPNDSAVLTLDFKSGVHRTIYVSSVRHPDHSFVVSVNGNTGRMDLIDSLKADQAIKGVQMHEDELKPLKVPDHYYEGVDRTKSGWELYMEPFKKQPFFGYAFVESVLNNKIVPLSFYERLKVQETMDTAFRSDESDTLVTL
jgi:predicted dehydrogenase